MRAREGRGPTPGTKRIGRSRLVCSPDGFAASVLVRDLKPGGASALWWVVARAPFPVKDAAGDEAAIPGEVFVVHGAGSVVGNNGVTN